ncbi:MAG: phage tail assembly protein [Aeromonas sp.]
MMKPVTLPTPIKRGETEISVVHFRAPKGGELRGLETIALLRMDYVSHRTLIPRICPEITANDIDQMDPKTLLEVQQEVVGFFVE